MSEQDEKPEMFDAVCPTCHEIVYPHQHRTLIGEKIYHIGCEPKPASPVAEELTELENRINEAIRRITHGQGQMRIPAEMTDPDLVLGDCKRSLAALRAENEKLKSSPGASYQAEKIASLRAENAEARGIIRECRQAIDPIINPKVTSLNVDGTLDIINAAKKADAFLTQSEAKDSSPLN